jgi:hypothetical protein
VIVGRSGKVLLNCSSDACFEQTVLLCALVCLLIYLCRIENVRAALERLAELILASSPGNLYRRPDGECTPADVAALNSRHSSCVGALSADQKEAFSSHRHRLASPTSSRSRWRSGTLRHRCILQRVYVRAWVGAPCECGAGTRAHRHMLTARRPPTPPGGPGAPGCLSHAAASHPLRGHHRAEVAWLSLAFFHFGDSELAIGCAYMHLSRATILAGFVLRGPAVNLLRLIDFSRSDRADQRSALDRCVSRAS